jgi:hypothetical protein
MSLPWANTKADVLAVRKTVRRRSYHQFIGEGGAVNYLARQRDNEYAVTGNADVPIRFHRIRRGPGEYLLRCNTEFLRKVMNTQLDSGTFNPIVLL